MENFELQNPNDQSPESRFRNDAEPLTGVWHYLDFCGGRHDANYIEWKYFNFKQKDIAGYIIYFILDPGRKTKIGGARVLARVFRRQRISGSIREIPIDKVQFDALSAGVDMDGAKILEKDQHDYEISGEMDDLSWDLRYKQQVPSIDAFENVNCGVLRWEKADWLVKMPRAKVDGIIKTGAGTIKIDAIGYSDTNWGEFLPFLSKYEWGQYNDEKISFIFGVLYKLRKIQSTYFYLIIDNEIVWLESPEFSIEHKKWGTNGRNGIRIPLESAFTARDKQFSIRFTSRLINGDLMGLKISTLLPKSAVAEQIVEYKGVIEKNSKVIYEFEGLGFQEWSVKTWKETPIAF
jgi:hypothetical protein